MSRIYRVWSIRSNISLINSGKSSYKRYNCGSWFVEVVDDVNVKCYSTVETHALDCGSILEVLELKPENWLDSFPDCLLGQDVKSVPFSALELKYEAANVQKHLVGGYFVLMVGQGELQLAGVLEDLKELGLSPNDMKHMSPSILVNNEESKNDKKLQEESSRESKARKVPPHISGRIMAPCMVHN